MKARLLALAAVLALAAPALAAPPRVVARAVFIANGTTGEVLYRYHARDRRAIASITKLMTALVTLERARLNDEAVVPPEAAAVGESSAGLVAGERLTVRELLEAALVQSANDAAFALAYHVGGGSVDRFVGMMNRRARELGLADTHFTRPDGLDAPGHFSSARDVTKLARIAMRNRFVRRVVALRTATISGGRTLETWNDLLGTFPGVIGVKTGHTGLAGWSQVAAARGPGVTVYATLLGSPGRARRDADLSRLLTWALSRYRLTVVVAPGRVYGAVATNYGRGPVRLVAERRLVRAVRVDRPLVERVTAARSVELPVRRGERLGEVRIYERGRLIGRRALVADRSIARPGLVARVRWYVGRAAENAWGWIT